MIKRTQSLKMRLPRPKTRKKRTFTRLARRLMTEAISVTLDTYEKGLHDVLEEENMEVSEEEQEAVEQGKDEMNEDNEKALLPPEVFEHLRSSAAEVKEETKPARGKYHTGMLALMLLGKKGAKQIIFRSHVKVPNTFFQNSSKL